MFIATLIAADGLLDADISDAEHKLRDEGLAPMGRSWIERDIACDILFSGSPKAARAGIEGGRSGVDVVVQGEAGRRKRLLVADMDSTMITVECIDELADYAGFKEEVSAITDRAMRGEIEFAAALRERVALLEALEEATVDRCREERVLITPGAEALVRTMRRDGAHCLLVSGGFTHFADKVGYDIGFDRVLANRLEVSAGRLTGQVAEPILDAGAKLTALTESMQTFGLERGDVLAIGDGANDAPMLAAAGLGVAFRAKPAAIAAASARLDHNDLSALLYAQGYARDEWAV